MWYLHNEKNNNSHIHSNRGIYKTLLKRVRKKQKRIVVSKQDKTRHEATENISAQS
jgi:hypothetical protein